jgi:hypothetical protein
MEGWANEAYLEILIDKWPDKAEFVFEKKTIGMDRGGVDLYFAKHKSGAVRFMCDSHNGKGYGGAVFILPLTDGTVATVKGPWSSRAGVMNLYFPHSVDVTFFEGDWKNCGMSGSLSIEAAMFAAGMAGVKWTRRDDGDISYRIKGKSMLEHKTLCW